jgi:hypothetical protein
MDNGSPFYANGIPTADEIDHGCSILFDVAHALLISGMKRIPPKLLVAVRLTAGCGVCAYEFKILDIVPIDPAATTTSPEQAATRTAQRMLSDNKILYGVFMQSSVDGLDLDLKVIAPQVMASRANPARAI